MSDAAPNIAGRVYIVTGSSRGVGLAICGALQPGGPLCDAGPQQDHALDRRGTRDERVYENPDTFDIGRESNITAVFYGFGVHRCLGMHLARIELRVAFEELLARFPSYEIDPSRAVHTVMSNVRGVSALPANLRASH